MGGTTVGVFGWCRGGGVGEPKEVLYAPGDGEVSNPRVLTSSPSERRTVPSARSADSKSRSVRDTRR